MNMARNAEGGPDHVWRAGWYACKLIEPCRAVARIHGYAIAEHGTKRRDIDWIAVPWVDDPGSPRTLVEAIIAKIGEIHGGANYCRPFDDKPHEDADPDKQRWEWARNGCDGEKPQGRLTWTIHLGGGPYIDLSVIPPR
jgi:hypothetical protein